MGLKQKAIDLLQKNLGAIAETITKDLKLVMRGKLVIDINKKQVRTEGLYLAIVDKSTGKDIFKTHLPFVANLNVPSKLEIPIEIKGDFRG